jgi:hypothetical protein
MKFSIISISFLILLFSCNSTDDQVPVQSTNELIQQFKPFLHGVWVQADYIDDIVKTKSPVKSGEKLTFITELIIDTSNISADSLIAGIALGNHEGSDLILYFKQGKTPTSLIAYINGFEDEPDSHDLGYEIRNDDTLLTICHYDKNQKLLDKIKYMRVAEVAPGSTLEDGFQYMVNKVTDSAGIEISVKLTNDGIIDGLPGFKTYYVITDFVASPEDSADKICFDIQTDRQSCYTFEIRKDTIDIFKAPVGEPDTLTKVGSTVYRFVKQL